MSEIENENSVKPVVEKSRTLVLDVPFLFNGLEYTEIEIRRPKGSDIKDMVRQKAYEQDLWLLCRCSAIPYAALDEMDGADIKEGAEIIKDFLSRGKRSAG